MIARGASLEDMREALHYVAPVGEKSEYVERATAIILPFITADNVRPSPARTTAR